MFSVFSTVTLRSKPGIPALWLTAGLGLAAGATIPAEPASAQMSLYFSKPPGFLSGPLLRPEVSRSRARRSGAALKGRGKAGSAAALELPSSKPTEPLQLIVSLPDQRLDVYAGSARVASAPVSTGKPGHATPKGIFTILQKNKWHRSNIYSGAPMPYMQRLTWSGVALHAGDLPGYPASHGCIRLPRAFAERLWKITDLGTRVLVAGGREVPVPFDHPQLTAVEAAARSVLSRLSEPETVTTPRGLLRSASLQIGRSRTDAAGEAPSSEPASPPTAFEAAMQRNRAITVFMSRKSGRLHVRQGYEPLFESSIVIEDREAPIGTHVFTVQEKAANGRLTWTAVTLSENHRSRSGGPSMAAEALQRVVVPPDVIEDFAALLIPGSSLIISDHGISNETGKFTDIIVTTR